jgi:hypothetical protein
MANDERRYEGVKARLDPLIRDGVDVSPMRIGTREHGAEWSLKYVKVSLADLERLFSEAMQARQLKRSGTGRTQSDPAHPRPGGGPAILPPKRPGRGDGPS